MTLASVVIPAHDEAALIDRTLAALRRDPAWDELEVVVVCNGCQDDTAARARAHGVNVVETAVASKAAALDLGDDEATAFPRVYLDADVVVGPGGISALVAALADSGAPAGGLAVRFDAGDASRVARLYHDAWSACPHFSDRHLGAGLYALTAAGRGRFDRFPPDAVPDDLFVLGLFRPAERVVADGWFAPAVPRTAPDLVRVRRRHLRARWALAAAVAAGDLPAVATTEAGRRWIAPLLRDPRRWPAVAAFVTVTGWAQLSARRLDRRAAPIEWERDRSTHDAQLTGAR